MPTHPTFTHENAAVNNFVNLLFISNNLNNRAQLILMSGVALNNVGITLKYFWVYLMAGRSQSTPR